MCPEGLFSNREREKGRGGGGRSMLGYPTRDSKGNEDEELTFLEYTYYFMIFTLLCNLIFLIALQSRYSAFYR